MRLGTVVVDSRRCTKVCECATRACLFSLLLLVGCGARTQPLDPFERFDGGVDVVVPEAGTDLEAPPGCPPSRPPLDSACAAEALACEWVNDCGDIDRGTCLMGRWRIDAKPCGGECPKFTPFSGAHCARRSTCVYVVTFPARCKQVCECPAAGTRWNCAEPLCAE